MIDVIISCFALLLILFVVPSNAGLVVDGSINTNSTKKTWIFPADYDEGRWRQTGHRDAELVARTHIVDPATNETRCVNEKPYHSQRKSQFAEDVWLYEHWFYGIKDGLLIESGAYQGVAMSNSWMFQRYSAWKSLHIEGDPYNFEKLVENRPEALNINAALINETRQLHYLTGGTPTTRGFYEFMSEKFIKDWHGGEVKAENLIPVTCIPITEILRKLRIKHVDIWFLDVEGAEENVLQGVDFSAIKFNAIVMECDSYNRDRNAVKLHILKRHHYDCVHLGMTCFCKHEKFIPSESPCGFSV